jgi:hypothetical protein
VSPSLPVVSSSPLIGRPLPLLFHVLTAIAIFLAGGILEDVGSVGLSFIYWVIGFFISISILSVYLEFASYFPSRSGAEVVYLEQSYLRPKYLFPTVFAVQSVLFSFGSGNSIG